MNGKTPSITQDFSELPGEYQHSYVVTLFLVSCSCEFEEPKARSESPSVALINLS